MSPLTPPHLATGPVGRLLAGRPGQGDFPRGPDARRHVRVAQLHVDLCGNPTSDHATTSVTRDKNKDLIFGRVYCLFGVKGRRREASENRLK